MFDRLSSREKNLVFVMLVILVGFILYKFMFQGQLGKNAELKEILGQEEARLEQSRQIADSLEKVTLDVKNSSKEVESVSARFITKIDDGSAEVKLGKDAKLDAVRVLLFQPLQIVIAEDYVELPIRMEVEGKYAAIVDFMTSIEGFFNLTEIKDLHIKNEKIEEFAWDPKLKASFSFSVYTTNPPKENSSYTDLTQWTVGKLNTFTVGIRSLAEWETSEIDGADSNTGTDVSSGVDGEEDGSGNLPPEGSNDVGVMK